MTMRRLKQIAFGFAIIVLAGLIRPQSASAKANFDLTCQQNLIYRSDYNVTTPQVIVDNQQNVHFFWVEFSPLNNVVPAIFHADLSAGFLSDPKPVLLSPDLGVPNGLEVASDQHGNIYIIFTSADRLYFSKAKANEAGQPLAWMTPQAISTSLLHAGIFVDQDGTIHVVYPDNDGVFYMFSRDQGAHWSLPVGVASVQLDSNAPDYVHAVVDRWGGIHVVWTEFKLPRGWPPAGIYYSGSLDGGKTWSEPHVFMTGQSAQSDLVALPSGEIHVGWNGWIALGGRYHSFSTDRGQTWSNITAVIPAGVGGISGYPDLVFDSSNRLYYVVPAYEDAIVVVPYSESGWTAPQVITDSFNPANYQNFSVEHSRAVIQNGNKLNVVFESGFVEIYHVLCLTSAPEILPPESAFDSPTQVISYEKTVPVPEATVTVKGEINFADIPAPSKSYIGLPILSGVFLSLVLLLFALSFVAKRRL